MVLNKRIRVFCLIVLAGVLAAGMLLRTGAPIHAAEGDPAITTGPEILKVNSNTMDAQTVYMAGKKWYLIGYGKSSAQNPQVASSEGTMTLITNRVFKSGVKFNDSTVEGNPNHYSGSNLKAEVDAAAETFSTGEKSGIVPRTLVSGSFDFENTDCVAGDPVENALLWPLSTKEASMMDFSLRLADPEHPNWAIARWWLRSPGKEYFQVAMVHPNGTVEQDGHQVNLERAVVRPAFNYYLDSVVLTSAAEGGKASGEVGPNALTEVGTNASDEWKLTVKDPAHQGFTVESPVHIACNDKELPVKYSGAVTGDNEYISAIIKDKDGNIKYYGRIKNVKEASDASGTAAINIEGKYELGDRFYVFNEQFNGDLESEGGTVTPAKTDFSSELKEVEIPGGGHNFRYVGMEWSDDFETANGLIVCKNDPKHKFTVDAEVNIRTIDSTCEGIGIKIYTAEAEYDGITYTETKTTDIDQKNHIWTDPEYEWTEDLSLCSATRKCTVCGAVLAETAKASSNVTTPPTCEVDGEKLTTAEFENEEFEKQETTTPIEKTGHKYRYKGMVWADDFESATGKVVCENDPDHTLTVDAEVEIKTVDSTCEGSGTKVYIARAVYEDVTYTETKTAGIDPKNHSWSAPQYKWSRDLSLCVATRKCDNCGTVEIETAGAMTSETVPPTCTEDGEALITAEFVNPAFETQEKTIPVEKKGHKWDEGKVTKEPTETEEGVKTFTCTVCGETKIESIPKLTPTPKPDDGNKDADDRSKKKGEDGTAVGKGASAEAAEKAITSMKNDNDPAGAKIAPLFFRSVKQTNTSIKLNWKKPSGAAKFVIYGNQCGKKSKMKKLKETKKRSLNLTKVVKKLKKGKAYKFILVSLDKDNNVVSTSKVLHVFTRGGKVTNAKAVKTNAEKNKVALKKGDTFTVKPEVVKAVKGLKYKEHVAMRYESSDTGVATVTKKGKIKAKAKGSCYVYVYSQNGAFAKIKVKVS